MPVFVEPVTIPVTIPVGLAAAHPVGLAEEAIPALRPGEAAPYVLLPCPPTMDECCAYFTLSLDQGTVFRSLAVALLDVRVAPVRQLVIGGPGSGKSRAAEAFLLFAFQHGRSSEVAVLSYTWRAALNIATLYNPGAAFTDC
jgi:hypothetical protein